MTESSAEDSEVWFEAWKKAEEVAMHFNDLMMNFRLKAIAGVTAATGVFGTILLTKGEVATTAQNFRLFAAVACCSCRSGPLLDTSTSATTSRCCAVR